LCRRRGLKARRDILPLSLPPRGLAREQAAAYVGISVGTFDQMVDDGRMPAPKVINRRQVWDRHALDLAFDALPDKPGRAADAEDVWAKCAV
jgi:excisionase family DNA binding protein